jgi:xylose isomerase
MLDLAKKVEHLDGLELVGNWHVNDENIHEMARIFKDHGFRVSMIVPDLWTQAKWGRGSLAAPDPRTREAGVDEIRKVVDWAEQLGCPYVDVWLGQDGYDYPFQADYIEACKWIREGLAACLGRNDKVKVLIEYKAKEPRTHCFASSAAKVLLLLQGLDQIGAVLDIGHALAAGENAAEATALLSSFGKLDYVHLNDNYRSWDDDMMFGSVHVVEALEFVYWLKRLDYRGWISLDIFPYREEKVPAATQSRDWLEALFRAVDRVGMESFAEVIRSGDGCEAVSLVRRALNV